MEYWRCSIIGTHYPLRGGASDVGAYCGAFFVVVVSDAWSITYWDTGAALSFKPFSTHYAFRGGPSDLNTNCGMFSVAINYSSTTLRWHIGAALW